jgi:hypothetical protein
VLNSHGAIKRVMGLADARVDKAKGVVICSTVNAVNVGRKGEQWSAETVNTGTRS